MIDVNGVCFEPIKKVAELTHTTIYEGDDGCRYVVRPDKGTRTRNQAIIKLERERAKTGLSMRKFGMSIGISSSTYIRWKREGRVPDNEFGIKTVMNVFGVSKNEAIELIEEE